MQPRSKPVIVVSIFLIVLIVAAAISMLVGVAPLLRAAFLDRLSPLGEPGVALFQRPDEMGHGFYVRARRRSSWLRLA
jgi:hypothetical protein